MQSRSREKLKQLKSVLRAKRSMLIVLQDYPDPDALAAAASLRALGASEGVESCSVACSGLVGRAENRALARYLNLNLLPLADLSRDGFDVLAMVDTQPGTGNNGLPRDHVPDIVIDHHPIRKATRRAAFHDVRRRYGAASTILYEYLTAAGLTPDMPLATALVYGIRADTSDLGREAGRADVDAFLALYPLSNKRKLSRMETARLPRGYFALMSTALRNAVTVGRCIFSGLGTIDNPDMIGEVADLLLRNEESTWALCFGSHGQRLLLSLRTAEADADAGKLMHRIVGRRGTGGGHMAMAGGQIPLRLGTAAEIKKTEQTVTRRFLSLLNETESARDWLVPTPGRKREHMSEQVDG